MGVKSLLLWRMSRVGLGVKWNQIFLMYLLIVLFYLLQFIFINSCCHGFVLFLLFVAFLQFNAIGIQQIIFVSSLLCLFPRLLFVVGKDSLEGTCRELFFLEIPKEEKSVQWERLLKEWTL